MRWVGANQMANNRIFLYCKLCRDPELHPNNAVQPVTKFLAKTFLNGYYTNEQSSSDKLDEWFELHNHGLEYNIGLEYEHPEEEKPAPHDLESQFGGYIPQKPE